MPKSMSALPENTRAQIEALHVLGRFEGPKAVPVLVTALASRDADIRALASAKLVFAGRKDLIPLFLRLLKDPEPRVRQHAIYGLQRLGAKQAADKIARMTNDPVEAVRLNAVSALAELGGRKQKAALRKLLDDANPSSVFAALTALVKLDPARTAETVLSVVANPKRWGRLPQTLRDVTLRLFGSSIRKPEVVAVLRKIVSADLRDAAKKGSPSYSMEGTEAALQLAEVGDALGLPIFGHMLRKGGEYGKERASRAVSLLRAKSAAPLLISGPLANGFYPIKIKAVKALGEIGEASALPALGSFFSERTDDFWSETSAPFSKDDPDLRLHALAAMAKIARHQLREAARAGDAFEKKTARRLLAELE